MKLEVVVDTSVFVDFLRGVADDTLAALILNNQVLLSPIVRLELLSGVNKKQMPLIENLFSGLKQISDFPKPTFCETLLKKAKGSGLFGGIPDLLIIAGALNSKSALLTYDKKMKKLAQKLGAVLF